MIEIDGAEHSGSGTIVRTAMALAALRGEELHLVHMRAKRPQPGLRPQHVQSVRAIAQLSGGTVEGDAIGARELWFRPGRRARAGYFAWDIGTAGSTTMLALGLLPLAAFAAGPCVFRITGGLFQDFAPSALHMRHVLLPALEHMGFRVRLRILRPGYVPRGGGILELETEPASEPLVARVLPAQRPPFSVRGFALSSHLAERRVSERLAQGCQSLLGRRGFEASFEVSNDETALQPGAALAVIATDTGGARLGADAAGARNRSAESLAERVAIQLCEDIGSGATTDRHLADQLVIFGAMATGTTQYVIPRVTDHVETNAWLVEKVLGARVALSEHRLTIIGTGYGGTRQSRD